MKQAIFLSISLFFFNTTFSQKRYASNHPDYIMNVDSADYHFENNDYELANPFYEKALKVEDYSFRSKFRLAICHFESGSGKGNDWLAKCAKQNWENICEKEDNENIETLKAYSDMVNWASIEGICKIQISRLDSQLIKEIAEIDKFDQGIRRGDLTEEDYKASGNYSMEMGMMEVDSVNLERMEVIFEKHGYPGKDLVGPFLSYTGYLVLQHADHMVEFQERYYDLLKEAVENHQVAKYTIAYLTDRIKVNKGECQDFGTQMGYSEERGYFIRPINDIENLAARRKEYQMEPIESYLENWGLTLSKEDECPK